MGTFSQTVIGYTSRILWSDHALFQGICLETTRKVWKSLFGLAENAKDVLAGYSLNIRRTGPNRSFVLLCSNEMRVLRDRQLSCLRFFRVSTSLCTRSEEKIPTVITIVFTLCEKRTSSYTFRTKI